MGKLKKYSHGLIHNMLVKIYVKDGYNARSINQALFCPYYVELSGVLGADWGIIVNPESRKFGELVFEHDDCGCESKDDYRINAHSKDYQEIEDAWEDKYDRGNT